MISIGKLFSFLLTLIFHYSSNTCRLYYGSIKVLRVVLQELKFIIWSIELVLCRIVHFKADELLPEVHFRTVSINSLYDGVGLYIYTQNTNFGEIFSLLQSSFIQNPKHFWFSFQSLIRIVI